MKTLEFAFEIYWPVSEENFFKFFGLLRTLELYKTITVFLVCSTYHAYLIILHSVNLTCFLFQICHILKGWVISDGIFNLFSSTQKIIKSGFYFILKSWGTVVWLIFWGLEIKLCGLGSRIRDVEAFWYKTDIKIIYFVPLCLTVSDCMVYPDPRFLIFKKYQKFRVRVNYTLRHNQNKKK